MLPIVLAIAIRPAVRGAFHAGRAGFHVVLGIEVTARRVGRLDGVTVGRLAAYAALARNNGSNPRLNNANPPAFTKTRLETVIVFESPAHRGPSPRRGSLPAAGQRYP